MGTVANYRRKVFVTGNPERQFLAFCSLAYKCLCRLWINLAFDDSLELLPVVGTLIGLLAADRHMERCIGSVAEEEIGKWQRLFHLDIHIGKLVAILEIPFSERGDTSWNLDGCHTVVIESLFFYRGNMVWNVDGC